jgi:dTMP kinase
MYGRLYVFEGIDGAGKSSALETVKNLLIAKDYDVVTVKNISDGRIGKLLRDIINHKEPYLNDYYIANLFLAELHIIVEEIKKHLTDGKIVLCDRWFYSTIAYLDDELFYHIIEMAKFDIKPYNTFYVNVAPKVAIDRLHARGDNSVGDVFTNIDKSTKQYRRYHKLINYYTECAPCVSHWFTVIDGEKDAASVAETIFKKIEDDTYKISLLDFQETLGDIGVDYTVDIELPLTPCEKTIDIVVEVMKSLNIDVAARAVIDFETPQYANENKIKDGK